MLTKLFVSLLMIESIAAFKSLYFFLSPLQRHSGGTSISFSKHRSCKGSYFALSTINDDYGDNYYDNYDYYSDNSYDSDDNDNDGDDEYEKNILSIEDLNVTNNLRRENYYSTSVILKYVVLVFELLLLFGLLLVFFGPSSSLLFGNMDGVVRILAAIVIGTIVFSLLSALVYEVRNKSKK